MSGEEQITTSEIHGEGTPSPDVPAKKSFVIGLRPAEHPPAPGNVRQSIQTPPPDPNSTESRMQALSYHYARTRDPQARNTLILYHQKLVHYIATRFLGSGETLEDLIQVANVGLINALDRYDPTKDVKFSTYAMPTIIGEIKRHFRDKTWQVKVPRWLQELSVNARKAQQVLTTRLGRTPTVRELATELGTTEDRTLEALEINYLASTVSLDTRLDAHAGSESATLMDIIGDLDGGLRDFEAYSDLRRALESLEARERQVIQMRFFEDLSQAKIANQLNISQMHVSRLQQKALRNLYEILAEREPRRARLRRKISTLPIQNPGLPN